MALYKLGQNHIKTILSCKCVDPEIKTFKIFGNQEVVLALHKKWSFPLRISSVNVTKSAETADLVTFTKLRIWSHLLKKSLIENFIFCAVICSSIWIYKKRLMKSWYVLDYLRSNKISSTFLKLMNKAVFDT